MVRDLIAIAQIPAPTFAEEPRLAWLERRLDTEPGTFERDAVGNLIWRLADGPVDTLLLAHVDTVFDAATALAVGEEDGWLHGAGVGDNAAAIAVALAVAPALAGRPLAVAFTVGEEGLGNLRGALNACATLRPARAIALEGHGLDEVCVDAVGSTRGRIVIERPGGHSWWDRGRPSAIHDLIEACSDLLHSSTPAAPINIGLVDGGTAVNAIAARAEALVECRSLDQAALDAFAHRLEGNGAEVVGRRPAGRLDRADPLLAAVRAARAELDLPDVLGDGSTDANAALHHGIPALSLGCARGHDMHARTERIERASLDLGVRQLDGTLRRLLKEAR